MGRLLFSIFLILCSFSVFGQDISLMNLRGLMPGTLLNPALPLEKKLNISLGAIAAAGGTNGPSVQNLTSINSSGQRFLDFNKLPSSLDESHDLFLDYNIRTLDVAYKINTLTLMAGHGFRSSSNIKYTSDLLGLLAFGNAKYIGETLDIGPIIDVMAYNELYIGGQKTSGKFTIGFKTKLLYGTSSINTESSKMLFNTNPEFYQLELTNDYTIRSSSLFRYKSLDSISVNYSSFTFDNLFFNNRGFALDLGVNFQVTKELNISASALDIGSIGWDFFPRKYTSKGAFSFTGVDIVDYIQDSTLSVEDTLLNLINISSGIEAYSTPLNNTFTFGATYNLNKWSFSSLYQLRNRFGFRNHLFSTSVMRSFSIFNLGMQYTLARNDFFAIGLFGQLKLGPFSAYLSSENILGVFRPLDTKSASVRIGTTLQF